MTDSTTHTIQVIPGSERYYCRVEGCDEFTAGNVPYGRCGIHALERLGGAEQTDKFGFPAEGTVVGQHGAYHPPAALDGEGRKPVTAEDYEKVVDFHRDMALRFSQDRDKLKHENRALKNEITALKANSQPLDGEGRLQALAYKAALRAHNDGPDEGGHTPPFASCPHPDCVLVRSVTALPEL